MGYAFGLAYDIGVVKYFRKPQLDNHSDGLEFHFGTSSTMESHLRSLNISKYACFRMMMY
jgi:hypothetical protein